MIGEDDGLRELLRSLSPSAHGHSRNVLIHDQADRDAIASQLLRYRDEPGDDWADIIDMLTLHPDARQKVVRLLGEIATVEQRYDGEPGGRTERNSPVVRALEPRGLLKPALKSRVRRDVTSA